MSQSQEQQAKEFFQQEARKEGISLRAFCKKYGIVYESFFGRDDYEDIPGGKVYLSQLHTATADRSHSHDDNPNEDSE
jgi:hypothetical protein